MMTTLTHMLQRAVQGYLEYDARRSRRLRHPVLRRARHLRWLLWISFAGLVLFLLAAPPAEAAFRLFDPMMDEVQNQSTNNWFTSIQGLVRPTFLILGTIEICWAAAIWAFEKDSLNSLSIEIIKKIMFHGFFYAVLLYAQDWIPAITNSFQTAGEIATQAPTLSTDTIIQMGLDVIGKLWAQAVSTILPIIAVDPEEILGTANPVAYAVLALGEAQYVLTAIATVIIAFAYVVVAAQYFTLKLESYVLFAAGAIFLGMGSSSFTRDYVTKYLNYAINVGVRLLVLILILSITLNEVSQQGSGFTFGNAFDYSGLLGVMAAAVLQAILAMKAPDMAGALMGGGPGLTAGGIFNTVLSTAAQMQTVRGLLGGAARGAAAEGAAAGSGRGGPTGPYGSGPGSLRNAVSAGQGAMLPQPNRVGATAALEGLGGRVGAEMNEAESALESGAESGVAPPPPGSTAPLRVAMGAPSSSSAPSASAPSASTPSPSVPSERAQGPRRGFAGLGGPGSSSSPVSNSDGGREAPVEEVSPPGGAPVIPTPGTQAGMPLLRSAMGAPSSSSAPSPSAPSASVPSPSVPPGRTQDSRRVRFAGSGGSGSSASPESESDVRREDAVDDAFPSNRSPVISTPGTLPGRLLLRGTPSSPSAPAPSAPSPSAPSGRVQDQERVGFADLSDPSSFASRESASDARREDRVDDLYSPMISTLGTPLPGGLPLRRASASVSERSRTRSVGSSESLPSTSPVGSPARRESVRVTDVSAVDRLAPPDDLSTEE